MAERRTRRVAAFLAAWACWAVPQAASAQAERVTELNLNYTLRHDSNVARTSEQAARARNLSVADQRVTPAVDLILIRPLGRNRIDLRASAGYDFYRRNDQLNRERLNLIGTGSVTGGPCVVAPTVSFSRRQSDLGDIGFVGVPGIASVRNVQTIQRYGAQLSCGRTYGLRPLFTIDREIGDNSNARRSFISDYRSTRYGAGVALNTVSLGELSVQASRDDTDYPNRPSAFGSGDGFRTNRLTASLVKDIGARLTANASVSYIDLVPQGDASGNTRDFNGFGYAIGLTLTPGPAWRFAGNFARDTQPSLGADALYSISENYLLEATYALSRRITLGLTGTLNTRELEGAGNRLGPILTDSRLAAVFGTVNFAYSQRLNFALESGYQERNANGTLYDFDNFYVALRTRFTL